MRVRCERIGTQGVQDRVAAAHRRDDVLQTVVPACFTRAAAVTWDESAGHAVEYTSRIEFGKEEDARPEGRASRMVSL